MDVKLALLQGMTCGAEGGDTDTPAWTYLGLSQWEKILQMQHLLSLVKNLLEQGEKMLRMDDLAQDSSNSIFFLFCF